MKWLKYFPQFESNVIETDVDFNSIISKIKSDCKYYLNLLDKSHIEKVLNRNSTLPSILPERNLFEDFPVMYRASFESNLFEKKKVRTDRRPLDTNPWIHKFYDSQFEKEYGFKARSNSLFVSTYNGAARYKSHDLYTKSDIKGVVKMVFPIGKFDYLWSKDDLFNTIDESWWNHLFVNNGKMFLKVLQGNYKLSKGIMVDMILDSVYHNKKFIEIFKEKDIVNLKDNLYNRALEISLSDVFRHKERPNIKLARKVILKSTDVNKLKKALDIIVNKVWLDIKNVISDYKFNEDIQKFLKSSSMASMSRECMVKCDKYYSLDINMVFDEIKRMHVGDSTDRIRGLVGKQIREDQLNFLKRIFL